MRLGVCTGGGDCPGLNAAIRAVVKHAIGTYGARVYGIQDSFNGLIEHPLRVRELSLGDVTDTLAKGGTILGTTNAGDPFAFPGGGAKAQDLSKLCVEGYRQIGLDALIVIGGDGTQLIAGKLGQLGLNIVGVPKTIDNDLVGTDQTIGFDTAVQIATEAITRLQSTAESHARIMVLEVMGRDAGHIALHAGMAGGANVILVPEIPFQFAPLLQKIDERRRLGRHFSLVVVSEGAYEDGQKPTYEQRLGGALRLGGVAGLVAQELHKRTGIETRVTVLGHIQRGGSPSAVDRLLATMFATHAVDLAMQGKFGRVAVLQGRQVTDVPYQTVTVGSRPIDVATDPYLRSAEAIGICMGRPTPFDAFRPPAAP
ncbi:MAG: ATP-dependent 6-phosphofructokinase [Alphaproteobacteria bacterium]|nr:ATP-dependent 6-phosphofructokinase [Alphaproteobacteria bacterium]